jgi:hypothetical protein
MRYVILAILIYLVYLFVKRFLRNLSNKNTQTQAQQKPSPKKTYDVNMIQDAEYREIKKDE